MQQTVDLYESRCEIARLRSLLPSENIPPRGPSRRETVTVREASMASPKGNSSRRDFIGGVYVREEDETGSSRLSNRFTQL